MGTLLAVAYTETALAGLRDIEPKKIRQQIVARIDRLVADPHPQGSVQLRGVMDGVYEVFRIRQGDYRVLYSVRGETEILVLDIGHRKDVYRNR